MLALFNQETTNARIAELASENAELRKQIENLISHKAELIGDALKMREQINSMTPTYKRLLKITQDLFELINNPTDEKEQAVFSSVIAFVDDVDNGKLTNISFEPKAEQL